ncbi:MAG: hypothetical protein JJ959_12495 [Nisaea sp.]|uniref:HpcH/HpaI aldolase family protein n=1 Tax=Nisaea sp. TaxID=2024842 RepID=UPI001B10020B|nr:aldolase/citrate lyase family protein [Nisaea sp.]MBO6561353.1 hypothetical protein [Nisaea sp.]
MSLKKKLQNDELTIGSWLSFGYPPIAEMMAKVGYEWLVVDMEHTGIATNEMFQMIQVIELSGCAPLVRVGANDALLIKRAMDSGAHGVIVPMVCTADDAKMAVDSIYYPPRGSRGVGLSRAQDYGLGFERYKAWAEEETVLIAQIEHYRAAECIDEILAVDGIDGFIIGPYDLSGSLGHPGNFEHPDVVACLDRVTSAMKQSPKAGGVHVVMPDEDLLRRRVGEGYSFIAYGDDMVFLAEKLRDDSAIVTELLNNG